MRYFATPRGKPQVPVEIEQVSTHRFTVSLRGKQHQVDALTLEHGAVSMLVDDESYSVEFDPSGDEVVVVVRGQSARIDVVDERALKLRAATVGFAAVGRQVVSAPMPGKVVKVLVKVDEQVAEGQGLVVIEAMKMENELKSPKAGKITELPAREGS